MPSFHLDMSAGVKSFWASFLNLANSLSSAWISRTPSTISFLSAYGPRWP